MSRGETSGEIYNLNLPITSTYAVLLRHPQEALGRKKTYFTKSVRKQGKENIVSLIKHGVLC